MKNMAETGTKQFEVTGHDGVFLVRPDDIDAYLEKFKPMQLREKRTVKVNDCICSNKYG